MADTNYDENQWLFGFPVTYDVMLKYAKQYGSIPVDKLTGNPTVPRYSVSTYFELAIRLVDSNEDSKPPKYPFKYLYHMIVWDDALRKRTEILVFQRKEPDHFPYSIEDVKYIAGILGIKEEGKWYFGTKKRKPDDPEMPGELCKTREEVLKRIEARRQAEGDDEGKRKRLGLTEEQWETHFGHLTHGKVRQQTTGDDTEKENGMTDSEEEESEGLTLDTLTLDTRKDVDVDE